MDVAATELAFWILGPAGIVALILWRVRRSGKARPVSPSAGVTLSEPGWTERMFTDGVYSYGRAFSVNDALNDPEAMARISECGPPLSRGE